MKKLNCTYAVKTVEDYQFLKINGVKTFILGGRNFSRLGEFDNVMLKEIIQDAISSDLKIELDVDVFPTHQKFATLISSWQELKIAPSKNLAIRVLDLGLLDWFHHHHYQVIPLLEAGFHNLSALENVHEEYASSVSHYVLSKELIFSKQISYANCCFQKAVEFNLLAPILLFHSPRKLLDQYFDQNENYHQTLAASQESVHKGFIVRENKSGTLFYHPKHQCLLGKLKDLSRETLVKYVVDLRLIEEEKVRHDILGLFLDFSITSESAEVLLEKVTSLLPYPVTRGFFDVNKTDVLFPKLKNHHSEHDTFKPVAEVMDMIKGEGLIVRVADGAQLNLGDSLYFQSPQGNNGKLILTKLVGLQGDSKQFALENEIVKINFMKHFPADSTIFKIHDNISL